MSDIKDKFASKLKELIDKNGTDYLAENPYEVYETLVDDFPGDGQIAGAVLMFLVNGMLDTVKLSAGDVATLSKVIQKECSLNKKMSDALAGIFLEVYSDDNIAEWKDKELSGLREFIGSEFVCEWEGFAVWDFGGGTVDCHYEAKITMEPTEKIKQGKGLQVRLEQNTFLSAEAIGEYFREWLKMYLDAQFEEYCTGDDYYQPVVEDFEIQYFVDSWCSENGFNLLSCEGDGYDDGIEPKRKFRWR